MENQKNNVARPYCPHCNERQPLNVKTALRIVRQTAASPAETGALYQIRTRGGTEPPCGRPRPFHLRGDYGMAIFRLLDTRLLRPRLPHRGEPAMRDALMDLACIILCIAFAIWIGLRQVRKL
jgi:hypothetical protein